MGTVGSNVQGMVDAWLPAQAYAWHSSQINLMCELVLCCAAGVYFPSQAKDMPLLLKMSVIVMAA